MSANFPHYYWDTCVFIAFLNDERAAYGSTIDHITQHLEEAKQGECKIYCSTISIAEITAGNLKNSTYGTFTEFLRDYSSAVIQITPDPVVMGLASQLRDLRYTKGNGKRKLLTPDAIHLASAITLRDNYKVPITALHTFDDGKSKGPDGKGVPMLSIETWCEGIEEDPVAQKVITLRRDHPLHPFPRMSL
ncbi:type II toxin-antitoxin system VapC family toxin [Microvirga sp. RSM25]|uniref:type II toxin-antitoxin system VapC family toxin n=1 Tax=Microvirga sp. RSM25 TaxID=3273802 RepID=UPI00384A82BA